jgi:hypothetical protein
MINITGPVAMTLLEKDNVRYLLIADRHDAYNKNGCDTNSLMLHEYLDNLFRSRDYRLEGLVKKKNFQI